MDHGGVDINGTTVVLFWRYHGGPIFGGFMSSQFQLKIRLPEKLKKWVEEEAKVNRRSRSAEIVIRLEAEMKRQRQTFA